MTGGWRHEVSILVVITTFSRRASMMVLVLLGVLTLPFVGPTMSTTASKSVMPLATRAVTAQVSLPPRNGSPGIEILLFGAQLAVVPATGAVQVTGVSRPSGSLITQFYSGSECSGPPVLTEQTWVDAGGK